MLQRMLLTLAVVASAWILSTTSALANTGADETAGPAPEVVMYTTRTCGYCVRARAWFTEQNVAWEERDIDTSESARAEWKAYGGMGTPLILIDGKRFSGFSPAQLSAELAKYR